MKLSAALEYEKLREDAASWNKVILHRDGKFYHAYDWSAWLIKQYVCTEEFQQQRGDEKLLQVSRYPSKHGEYAMLGFPLDSISKYIPAYENARKMAERVDGMDMDFLLWLTEQIVMLDPKTSCKIIGTAKEWEGLDKNKSLFHTPDGCGLPIGNLTSQLFSNVYLNELDQYCKRTLGCKHYGRYVDDAYIVSRDKEWLLSLVPQIRDFLKDRLHLDLHMGKTQVLNVRRGVEFLGAFVKPYRTYISNESLHRMMKQVAGIHTRNEETVMRAVNSWLGVLSHYDSFNIKSELFVNTRFLAIGTFDRDMTVYELSKPAAA